jgi:tetratricopeptide (TPR) repeat protein
VNYGFLSTAACVAAALLSGCANSINAHTAQRYYESGVQAERANNLALARRNFSRAYGNAQIGNLGPAAEASYLYEYARVSGYAGEYEESAKAFIDVLALIDKAKGEADKLRPPALSEYARLLHNSGQHQKAVPIFEQATAALEKVGIESSDPLGYAALLDEYAESLNAAGFPDRASAISRRSASLKTMHKDESPTRKYEGPPDIRPNLS